MSKTLILSLFQRGDPKRKKVLYEAYQAVFHSPYSYRQVVLSINEDLGEKIIKEADVKYIREHFMKKQKNIKHEMISKPKEDKSIGISEEIANDLKSKVKEQNQDFNNKFLN